MFWVGVLMKNRRQRKCSFCREPSDNCGLFCSTKIALGGAAGELKDFWKNRNEIFEARKLGAIYRRCAGI